LAANRTDRGDRNPRSLGRHRNLHSARLPVILKTATYERRNGWPPERYSLDHKRPIQSALWKRLTSISGELPALVTLLSLITTPSSYQLTDCLQNRGIRSTSWRLSESCLVSPK